MKDIKEIEIGGERIFLKKNKYLGWAVVNPIQKDIKIPIYNKELKKFNKDNINWINLLMGGNIIKFILTIIIILLLLCAIFDYYHVIQVANECLNSNDFYSQIFK